MMLRSRVYIRPRVFGIRFQSTIPKPEIPKWENIQPKPSANKTDKPLSQREQITARQKIELAQTGLKDIFEGFLSNEESYEPIDIKPILAKPKLYDGLTEFQRQQIRDEIERKSKKNWNQLTPELKKMAYYVSYGNYGPREELSFNLFQNHIPEDLPFTLPSKISTDGKVHKLPPVDLEQISPARRANWNRMTRRLDPFTKAIVYLAAVISLIALYRDKYVEEEYISEGNIPESSLVLMDMEREKMKMELEKKNQEFTKGKKWYYLWLK